MEHIVCKTLLECTIFYNYVKWVLYVCKRSSGYFYFPNVPMQKESSLWAVLYSYSGRSTQEIWLHKQKSINVSPGIILAILP